MSVGWTIIISIAILCLTLLGLYAVTNWREVEVRRIELSLKVIQVEENRRKKLN
jgi:uncharacterized integral membrane protein